MHWISCFVFMWFAETIYIQRVSSFHGLIIRRLRSIIVLESKSPDIFGVRFNDGNDAEAAEMDEDVFMNEIIAKSSAELSSKVEAALQSKWDDQVGVNTVKAKALPLKANVDLWSYEARRLLMKGNFTGAAVLYEQCVAYNPTDTRAWLGLSRIAWKRRDTVAAERALKDGLYYCPKDPFLLQSYAVLLEKTGKLQVAIDVLLRSVKFAPWHAASWVALAGLHRRLGRLDRARQCFASAAENDRRSYVARQAWGCFECELGNVDKARGLFHEALLLSRNKSVHTLQAWATMERNVGNYDEAKHLLEQGLLLKPRSTYALLSMTELLILRGEDDKAREVFMKGERFAARVGDAGFFQAWALFEAKQMRLPTISEDLITSITASSPSPAAIYIPELNAEDSAYAVPRALFKKAVSVNKYHSASWVAWAKFEQRVGRTDIARKLLVAGISNFPQSINIAWFYCVLASVARQEGDLATARACYTRALDATPPYKSLATLLEFASMEAGICTRQDTFSQGDDIDLGDTYSGSGSARNRRGMRSLLERKTLDNLSSTERKIKIQECAANARRLFERVVKLFPSDKKAWDAYYSFESRLQSVNGPTMAASAVLTELGARRALALEVVTSGGSPAVFSMSLPLSDAGYSRQSPEDTTLTSYADDGADELDESREWQPIANMAKSKWRTREL